MTGTTVSLRLVVDLAYQRRPGNVFPDNDQQSRSLRFSGTRVIVCGVE